MYCRRVLGSDLHSHCFWGTGCTFTEFKENKEVQTTKLKFQRRNPYIYETQISSSATGSLQVKKI